MKRKLRYRVRGKDICGNFHNTTYHNLLKCAIKKAKKLDKQYTAKRLQISVAVTELQEDGKYYDIGNFIWIN